MHLISFKQARAKGKVLFSEATARRRQKEVDETGKPRFPRFVYPSPGCPALVEEELDQHNADLVAKRDAKKS